ncbi:MAG: threonine synthase [Acidobacteriota bacterium]|nr:threonine synthase [Acidobacteriota bacterium]
MRYLSTGGKAPAVDLRTALFRSLAPDGGLYLPESLPRWPQLGEVAADAPLSTTARRLAPPLLPDLPKEVVESLVDDALDFPVPLVPVAEATYILELFHGPTLAFKDVGARTMARLFAHLQGEASSEPLTVLVATSGDTGSAVAQAFLGVPGTRVVVLYPKGKVSRVQECQFTTLGENVHALAVSGTFDDCQRMVKAAFADTELSRQLRLTSANSINLGRLLPQSFYYAHGAAQLLRQLAGQLEGRTDSPEPPVFVVPSGNFGNLTAGLLAQRMGVEAGAFVAATNVNDVVPEYLEEGIFRPRPSQATLSNAMDVGNPSNFDRILWLYDGDRDAILRDLRGARVTDEETRETIRRVHQTTGYLLDPHTAVGWAGLEELRSQGRVPRDEPAILLATAHPAKFGETVEPLVKAEIPLPERLKECLKRPSRARDLEPEAPALEAFLRGL